MHNNNIFLLFAFLLHLNTAFCMGNNSDAKSGVLQPVASSSKSEEQVSWLYRATLGALAPIITIGSGVFAFAGSTIPLMIADAVSQVNMKEALGGFAGSSTPRAAGLLGALYGARRACADYKKGRLSLYSKVILGTSVCGATIACCASESDPKTTLGVLASLYTVGAVVAGGVAFKENYFEEVGLE